jgi:hypothetical protein
MSANREQLPLRVLFDRSLWNRVAKHKFIQEIREHEKTHIPYKSSHGDDSLCRWNIADSPSGEVHDRRN